MSPGGLIEAALADLNDGEAFTRAYQAAFAHGVMWEDVVERCGMGPSRSVHRRYLEGTSRPTPRARRYVLQVVRKLLGESTTEMPPSPGVTPEDPRQSTMRGEGLDEMGADALLAGLERAAASVGPQDHSRVNFVTWPDGTPTGSDGSLCVGHTIKAPEAGVELYGQTFSRLQGLAAWLPTPEQTRRFWGEDPMGPRRELAEGLAKARDDAEAEMREALGRLVALDVSSRVECEGVERLSIADGFAVRLVADAEAYDGTTDRLSFDGGIHGSRLDWDMCPDRFQWRATAYISDAVAAGRLRAVLGDETLAALQPKVEVRDGVATITRKTLRKDGGG